MEEVVEIWKSIFKYEGYCEISNLGRVRLLDRLVSSKNNHMKRIIGRIIKPSFCTDYLHVTLCMYSKTKNIPIHRTVMLAHRGESKLFVNHKNGIKTDNRLENLKYCTQKENIKHAQDIGLFNKKGSNHSQSKLVDSNVLEIIRLLDSGVLQQTIADIFNIRKSNVSRIKTGKRWGHLTGRGSSED